MAEEKSDPFDAVGVGRFAKDIAVLSVPMALVATLFGLWMNTKVGEFKTMIQEAVEKHATVERDVHGALVTRAELDAYKQLQDERNRHMMTSNEDLSRAVRRNTVLLERIATKVGVSRQGTD